MAPHRACVHEKSCVAEMCGCEGGLSGVRLKYCDGCASEPHHADPDPALRWHVWTAWASLPDFTSALIQTLVCARIHWEAGTDVLCSQLKGKALWASMTKMEQMKTLSLGNPRTSAVKPSLLLMHDWTLGFQLCLGIHCTLILITRTHKPTVCWHCSFVWTCQLDAWLPHYWIPFLWILHVFVYCANVFQCFHPMELSSNGLPFLFHMTLG